MKVTIQETGYELDLSQAPHVTYILERIVKQDPIYLDVITNFAMLTLSKQRNAFEDEIKRLKQEKTYEV